MSDNESTGSSSSQGSSTDGDALFIRCVHASAEVITSLIQQEAIIRRRNYINRDRAAANELLMRDYFCDEPVYNENQFSRRFRMSRRLFLRIAEDLKNNYHYFQQHYDARGKLGFTTLQKCTSAVRQLAYGTASDSWDDYLKMADKTSRDTLYEFCDGIIELYGAKYLRKATWSDIQSLYEAHEEVHGLPGMLGSIDCMHWEWANCPTAWHGQHEGGDHGGPTLVLEAVASYDLWIWHAFFGVAGSANDINVLDQSPLFDDLLHGRAPPSSFYANDNLYDFGYYLADGIYPEWSSFVKAYSSPAPDDLKRSYFKKVQESSRKDIERAFGVLKKRWHIIANPVRIWKKERIANAMYACIILHNMIIEDKGAAICTQYIPDTPTNQEWSDEQRIAIRRQLRDKDTHANLRQDLTEHVWVNRNNED